VRGVRVLALGAVLPVLALVARPADAQSLSPQEVFRRVSSSVVVIEVTDDDNKVIASGSGVVIPNRFKDGILKLNQVLVATNCHVVDQAPDGTMWSTRHRMEGSLSAKVTSGDGDGSTVVMPRAISARSVGCSSTRLSFQLVRSALRNGWK